MTKNILQIIQYFEFTYINVTENDNIYTFLYGFLAYLHNIVAMHHNTSGELSLI